jgi:hypothetical protein
MAKKAIYIEVEDRNPFGESVDERVFADPTYTSSYIPGYSEQVRQNELRKANNEPIKPLKHRFHWARCRALQDTERAEGRRVQHWKQKRYEVANYDDMIAQGYNLAENDAITPGPDRQAYWGEHVLMVASAEVAAAHVEKNRQAASDLEEKPQYMMDEAVERFNRTKTAKRTGMKAGAFEEVEVRSKKDR